MELKYEFYTSLRFELFYAIQLITDDASTIHNEWKQNVIKELPDSFFYKIDKLGLNGAIWPVLADIIKNKALTDNFDDLIEAIRELSDHEIQKNILQGALHYEHIVTSIMNKEMDLETAIKKIPQEKYEWLAYIGLYPFHKMSPIVITMEMLIDNPEVFKNSLIDILTEFWNSVFKNTWHDIRAKLIETTSEKQRLGEICTFGEFSKAIMLPIEVDEKNKKIMALRGGYTLDYDHVEKIIFLPSVFNYRRLWTAYESENDKTIPCFPFFDATISLTNIHTKPLENASTENTTTVFLDPALIFKALGDVTRFAIATMIAKEPKSSVDLSKSLSLTKATVSHHVHILREAGLIKESFENGSVKLSLKREVIENLSTLVITKFYGE